MHNRIKLWKAHNNGNIGWWRALVQVNEVGTVVLLTESCNKDGGKIVLHTAYPKGKNLGRANETTDWDQAIMEMESKGRKKQDKGYVYDKPEPGVTATNTLGTVACQKALSYSKMTQKQKDDVDWDNAFLQRKYDGHKCTTNDMGMKVTSGGKKFTTLDHILAPLGIKLDGEIYLHGLTLSQIGKLISKYRGGETEKLQYVVYDSIDLDDDFDSRISAANAFIKSGGINVVIAPTYKVTSWAAVDALHKQFMEEGYEGSILRQGTNGYKPGSRCKDIIKIKDFADAEFKILRVFESEPATYEGASYKQAMFECENPRGDSFNVLAHGTIPQKGRPLKFPAEFVGEMLTVKFFGWTEHNKPNIAVAKGMREDF